MIARRAGRSHRADSAACAGDMCFGSGGVGTPSDASCVDEPLDAFGLGALVHAVQARHLRFCEQVARRLRWRRSSDARSGGGTRSACGHGSRPTLPCSSKANSGSGGVDHQRAALLPRPLQRRRRLARGRERLAPWRRGAARRRRRCDRPARSPGARPSGSPSGRSSRSRPPRRRSSSSTVTARRSRAGHERAGVVGERLRQHRLDHARHVHARRAPARLDVDRRALRHVRADVGDVHPHARSGRRSCASAEIASSKSRALSGSIVKVVSPVRSRLEDRSPRTSRPLSRAFSAARCTWRSKPRARPRSLISDSIAERADWRACGGHTTRESCPCARRFPRPGPARRFGGEPCFGADPRFGVEAACPLAARLGADPCFGFEACFGVAARFGFEPRCDFGPCFDFEAGRGLGPLPFPRPPLCGRGLT